MIDSNSSIKLVDPRGITQDESYSIFGDVMYDYAKILQSLCGYDEILLTGHIFMDNSELIDILKNHIETLYGDEYYSHVKNIKNSLLFSLIPLHDNDNCTKFYNLIN
jgi:hypothetical protein